MPISNKEEIQIVKGWWQKYGYYFLFIVIGFLVVNFGWRYWHRCNNANLESSSIIYTQMLTYLEQQKNAEFELFGKRLIKDYPASSYASFAALLLAKEAVQQGNLRSALEMLQFVVKKAPIKKIRELARIRAARVLIAMKNPSEALVLLSNADNKDYGAHVSEIFGDAYLALGKVKNAEEAYRRAESLSKDKTLPLPLPLLKIKLQQF
ncbi:MAG: tetratricopeptide repeat protein [Coxiellaceae bacterium]|jgi:predicted negative regulator of RcsB-dependent stress response|nr:tetratricopeptide repeat protein [Coxiellaceae bacterium]